MSAGCKPDERNARMVFPMQRPDLILAALSGLDPRTVRKAIDKGVDAIKGRDRQERLLACASQAGVTLRRSASSASEPPPPSGVAA